MKAFRNWVLVALLAAPAAANAVVIGFTDPVGDHTGGVDATGLVLDIDEATGDYSIVVTADAGNPFVGAFRINVNLFNATLGEFFQDPFNDFDEAAPLTSITLTGTDADLTDWLPGHQIATSTFDGLGNPAGSSFFRTSVSDLPFRTVCVAEDIIGFDGCTPPQGIDEPASLGLGALALAALVVARRRCRALAG